MRAALYRGMGKAAEVFGVEEVDRPLAAGELTGLPVHKFPLADIAAAHQAAESGAVGKVVVTP